MIEMMNLDDLMMQETDDMQPQGHLGLEWRDRSQRVFLGSNDFIRQTENSLWCDVLTITPSLRLPWWYTEEQRAAGRVWSCGAVRLHSAAYPNGTIYPALLHASLEEAINVMAQNRESMRYSL